MGIIAVIFPGQGSQAVGMGRQLCDRFEVARRTIEEADDALGESLSGLMFDGPEELLTLTANQQPAILAVSIAAWRVLREVATVRPVMAAGHSLGEYSALVASGTLPFADAVRAVRARGRLMQEAVPVGEGAMAAVIGLAAPAIDDVVRTVADTDSVVAVSGYNSPQQTTISGSRAGVDRATDALKEAGAKRVLPLNVSAPFHSPLMTPVEGPLRQTLEGLELGEMNFGVVANASAKQNDSSAAVVDLLIRQVASPVRWVESIELMRGAGVQTFVELGHGRALAGMVKKIDRGSQVLSAADPDSIEATAVALAV